ncbi:MAG: hypothetical protein DRJ63_08110 [Thermoprotei archaeon]|nr:MAG: hypothetical protein DRJ63_08110 [Thermoprotei archaeon]
MIRVKAVLFDFYDTLVYGEGCEESWRCALEAAVDYLNSLGFRVSIEDFSDNYSRIRDILLERLKGTLSELDVVYLYWRLLRELGISPSIELVVRLLEVFYDIEVGCVRLYSDAIPTIEYFRERGVKTAIVSNATVRFEYIVRKLGLVKYFDVLMASYKVMKLKPHPRIFTETLRLLGVRPEEAVMIGDSYRADIAGAKRLGIRGVLIDRRNQQYGLFNKGLEPDAVIESLNELKALIEL